MQKFKVNGQWVPKIVWKQTDGRTEGQTDGGDCITSLANVAAKRPVLDDTPARIALLVANVGVMETQNIVG